MSFDVASFARSVSDAHKKRGGFQATQRVRAGTIDVTARIRVRRLDLVTTEFQSFASPLLSLEEQLVNGAEYTGDELAGLSFHFDGKTTCVYDQSSETAINKIGRALPEPLPGFRTLGEVGFLERLTRDFLLRDEGREEAGSSIHRLAIKPKTAYRSQLLAITTFPFRRALLAFDEETLFPRRIEFTPTSDTLLASLLPPGSRATIEYSDIIDDDSDAHAFAFAPPTGSRVFDEIRVTEESVKERAPFACSLVPLDRHGFHIATRESRLAVDKENERGFLSIVAQAAGTDVTRRAVTIRAGNYLSRNMGRRKAAISERGRQVGIGSLDALYLDRSADWPTEASETARLLAEVSWEKDGVYWFLLGEGLEEADLLSLATELAAEKDLD